MTEEENKAIEFLETTKRSILVLGAKKDWEKEEVNNLDTILNLIEKLQKENEELNIEIERQGNAREIEEEYIEKKFISKDKIREKINELEYFYKKEVKPIMYQWTDFTAEEHYKELIHNLKELLEEEE